MARFFRKDLNCLRPVNSLADESLAKLKHGDVVALDFRKPRCLGHHRLYWALMQLVAENMDGEFSAEVVSDVVKIRAGHVTVVKTAKGEVFLPASISFASMDQIQFNEFFDRALRVVVRDIIPGLNSDALRAEVEQIVAGGR